MDSTHASTGADGRPHGNQAAMESWRKLYPFAPHYTSVGGLRYHYVDEGGGAPVVMVHGNPTWSFMFRDLIRNLRDGRRTIAPDHIGCGLSEKPQDYPYHLENHIQNLEHLIDNTLQLPRLSLVVHDWGGAIGMGYAVRHPEKIDRIVILNSAAFLARRCPLRIRLCRIPLFGNIGVRQFNGFVRAALAMAPAHPERLSADVRAGYLAPYDSYHNRIATLRFVQDIPLRRRHPTWKTLNDIQERLPSLAEKPVLIVWGMKDFCFNPPFLDRWMECFPKAQVERLPDAGHYLLEDAADEVIGRVRSFLG